MERERERAIISVSVSSCFHLYQFYFNECFQRQLEKVWSIDLTIPLESPRGFDKASDNRLMTALFDWNIMLILSSFTGDRKNTFEICKSQETPWLSKDGERSDKSTTHSLAPAEILDRPCQLWMNISAFFQRNLVWDYRVDHPLSIHQDFWCDFISETWGSFFLPGNFRKKGLWPQYFCWNSLSFFGVKLLFWGPVPSFKQLWGMKTWWCWSRRPLFKPRPFFLRFQKSHPERIYTKLAWCFQWIPGSVLMFFFNRWS